MRDIFEQTRSALMEETAMQPEKTEMFYEGKAKKLYSTTDPDLVIQYFKDQRKEARHDRGKGKDQQSPVRAVLHPAREPRRAYAFCKTSRRSREAQQAAADNSRRNCST